MKAVFFDFDGTLTCKSPNIWKSIWEELGYDTGAGSEYKKQLDRLVRASRAVYRAASSPHRRSSAW